MKKPSSLPNATVVPGTKPKCIVFSNVHILSRHAAQIVAAVIRERNAIGQHAVLALPAGSTPISVYRELIRMHREDGLDFSGVVTFNIDEYFGITENSLQSYRRWIHEHFLNHINILPQNVFIPDGTLKLTEVAQHCRQFEAQIAQAGGLDLALLGIGSNGHIGFNEPFSSADSRTRLVQLDPASRRTAASDFFGIENVPTQALTMGLGTILESRKVLLLALGEHKANIIRATAEEPTTDRIPASFLKSHPDAAFLVDEAAAAELTPRKTPWKVGTVNWDERTTRRAVIWLCKKTQKPLTKLEDEDFRQNGMHQLLEQHKTATGICKSVFQRLMSTVEEHPAGTEQRKRVICFSPHPDDDVISMGGTLIRLNQDGHEVHIAYMTSGNIAVFDHDAWRVADLVSEYNRLFGIDREQSLAVESQVSSALHSKRAGEPDIDEVRKIKALIRWSEAKAGAIKVGCEERNCHFLDLPFYRTGTIDKNPWGPEDVKIIRDLLAEIKPHQIYVAGDLSDPHGTHRVCAEAIFQSLFEIGEQDQEIPEVLLYRGAWQEYELHEIDVAVPLTVADVALKKKAIFMHESQKDEALFPGSDPREFWQRAVDRNINTANQYNLVGLPEYFAMEAFVRWNGVPI
ncbi:MAG: glucosamine-6-phosphate deaminase [Pirellulaceae bacterium]|nr:glucosamine-6-phosphate deaminase [Pirellulaceae bacterium]